MRWLKRKVSFTHTFYESFQKTTHFAKSNTSKMYLLLYINGERFLRFRTLLRSKARSNSCETHRMQDSKRKRTFLGFVAAFKVRWTMNPTHFRLLRKVRRSFPPLQFSTLPLWGRFVQPLFLRRVVNLHSDNIPSATLKKITARLRLECAIHRWPHSTARCQLVSSTHATSRRWEHSPWFQIVIFKGSILQRQPSISNTDQRFNPSSGPTFLFAWPHSYSPIEWSSIS
ncbi:hypothetical protein V202x_06900 [Gimesia aquarii]|uniref:Uncharacterized protein n=1 Tax=Gimesia aquarii TaxID=2527964 RepID=A0A517WQ23_9PLAN|nr:hypothetical protein V202x_06900 [Gimesia aquarii]